MSAQIQRVCFYSQNIYYLIAYAANTCVFTTCVPRGKIKEIGVYLAAAKERGISYQVLTSSWGKVVALCLVE